MSCQLISVVLCRILEQRSREATEMDDMLQQELQLAKANHQKTVSSRCDPSLWVSD